MTALMDILGHMEAAIAQGQATEVALGGMATGSRLDSGAWVEGLVGDMVSTQPHEVSECVVELGRGLSLVA
jgi:hypothetical protein